MLGLGLVLAGVVAAAPEAPPSAAVRAGAPGPGVSQGGDGGTAFLGRELLPPVVGAAVLDVGATAELQARAYFRATTGDPNLELLGRGAEMTPRGVLVQQVQAAAGVPIEGTFATALIRQGALIFARHRLVVTPELVPHPTVSAAAAAAAAAAALAAPESAGMQVQGVPQLAVAYFGGVPRLTYRVLVYAVGDAAAVFVDARGGGVLGRESLRRDVVVGKVLGHVNPACGGDTTVERPLPYVQWRAAADPNDPASGFANAAGEFASATEVAATVALVSPYLKMVDAAEGIGAQAVPATLAPAPALNAFHLDTWPQVPLDAYANFHAMHHWFVARAGLSASQRAWGSAPVTMNLELVQHCNANYEPVSNTLNLYSAGTLSGMTCVDTATVPFVVHHEFGHGIAYHSGNAGSFDLSTAEGLADTAAILSLDIDHFSSIATGCPEDPRTARTCANAYTYCASGCTYHPDRTFSKTDPHLMGQVVCAAWNELRAGMVARYGSEAGHAVVNGLYLDHLATLSGTMPDTYQSAIAADADDDDNSGNGTLHSCEINEAFAASSSGSAPHFPELRGRLVPSRPSLAIAHVAPGTLSPAAGPPQLSFTLTPHPLCDPTPSLEATLYYTVDGAGADAITAVPLAAQAGSTSWDATLPVAAPATLRYWLVATLDGASFAYPFAGAHVAVATATAVPPVTQALRLADEAAPLFDDDFEAGPGDAQVDSDAPEPRTAWEWGVPAGLGGDPTSAHSGTHVVGTHLAGGGEDLSMRGVTSRLTLPPLTPARGEAVARLQFWQQRLQPTVARVEVNGQVVYDRPAAPTPLRDYGWRFEDVDIAAAAAAASPVVGSFIARNNVAENSAGDAWYLDEIRVLSQPAPAAAPASGGGLLRYAYVSTRGCAAGGAPVAWAAVAAAAALRRGRAPRPKRR